MIIEEVVDDFFEIWIFLFVGYLGEIGDVFEDEGRKIIFFYFI